MIILTRICSSNHFTRVRGEVVSPAIRTTSSIIFGDLK